MYVCMYVMGSSNNRHWPSMFKSKPHISSTTTSNTISNTSHQQQQQQWQHHHHHDTTTTTTNSSFHRTTTPYTPVEERSTPEPKPRWNPRPEQIRILESIFNSGMVNPPRDEIRKIRAQLQQYGHVGDANVFYWFQNRKSRTKHKQRQHHQHLSKKPTSNINITKTSSSSNSSSSDNNKDNKDKDKYKDKKDNKYSYSSPPPPNLPFFQASASMAEPFFFPVHQNTISAALGGFPPDHTTVGCPTFLLMPNKPEDNVDVDDQKIIKLQEQLTYGVSAAPNSTSTYNNNNNNNNNILLPFPSPTANHVFQGEPGPTKSTVFINDVCIEVGFGPFNVREAFGDDSVLVQSTGHPVLTNEWGVTLHPLQHGAFYYLVRAFAPSPVDRNTIDLI